MAYDKAELEAQALQAIEDEKAVFIEEVVSYLPCSKSTFCVHKLDQSDAIKEALEANRVEAKKKLRKKWADGENATTQIALYKLLSTKEELKKISGQHIDHTDRS